MRAMAAVRLCLQLVNAPPHCCCRLAVVTRLRTITLATMGPTLAVFICAHALAAALPATAGGWFEVRLFSARRFTLQARVCCMACSSALPDVAAGPAMQLPLSSLSRPRALTTAGPRREDHRRRPCEVPAAFQAGKIPADGG